MEKPCKAWLLAKGLGTEPRWQAGHPYLLPERVLDTQLEGNRKAQGTRTLSRQVEVEISTQFRSPTITDTHIIKVRAGAGSLARCEKLFRRFPKG